MHDLIRAAVDAHGGMDRWTRTRQISAIARPGGATFKLKGQEQFTQIPKRVSVATGQQKTTFVPFAAAEQRALFTPGYTLVESSDGRILEELLQPRASFEGQGGGHWSLAQLAYFVGYAVWMYLNAPFALLWEGVQAEEVAPWREDDETWRALKVRFPATLAVHSPEHTFYFDTTGRLRRLDYEVEIAGHRPTAHYLYDYQNFDGFLVPTKRRVYLRGSDRAPQKQAIVTSLDLGDFAFSETDL